MPGDVPGISVLAASFRHPEEGLPGGAHGARAVQLEINAQYIKKQQIVFIAQQRAHLYQRACGCHDERLCHTYLVDVD